jgi:hypothetical protein
MVYWLIVSTLFVSIFATAPITSTIFVVVEEFHASSAFLVAFFAKIASLALLAVACVVQVSANLINPTRTVIGFIALFTSLIVPHVILEMAIFSRHFLNLLISVHCLSSCSKLRLLTLPG